MSTKTTNQAVFSANINQKKIIDEITSAIDSMPIPKRGYRFIDTRDVAAAVDSLSRNIARAEAAAALYKSKQLRATFERFDGKIINRRFWSAVDSACYEFMPAADSYKNFKGDEIKPAAIWLTDGTFHGLHHFARVHWSSKVFGGSSFDDVIYGRCADWTTCSDAEKKEYKIITGARLDSSRAVAVLEYEASKQNKYAAELRAALAYGARIVSDYLSTVETFAAVLDCIPHAFLDAFGIGSSRTLPVTVHN